MTQYYSQLTNYGEKYIAAQIGAGKPINLATMAVGDGNGQNTTPTATQTALVHEVYRANTTDVVVDAENPNQVICEFLIPENVGDFWVREIGIFDEKGKLVAVANTPENYKPVLKSGSGKVQYYRIILAVSSSDNIKITLNQNIIFVTRVELDRFKNELSDSDGFRLVGQCNSIEQLRTIEPKENNQRILVKGYYDGSNKGGGQFEADFNDTQSADNGGTVIVTAGGKRWKRIYNTLSLYDFGYSGGNELSALDNAEKASLGEYIDCLGLTINTADKYPTKNKYKNGKFVIGGVEVNAQYNSPRTGIGRFISGSKAGEKLKSNEWTGADVIAIGEGAMANMEKCVSSIALGKRAQGTTSISRDNIAIGADTLYQVQAETEWYSQDKLSGTRNVAIGGAAGRGITTGYGNVAIGRIAGQNLESGELNVAVGIGAIGGIVPIGFSGDIEHGFPSKTKESVAVGANALNQYVESSSSVAIGAYAAEKLKKGLYNTAIGYGALKELESDVAPNGGWVLWRGNQSGSYSQAGNVITLTFDNLHGADVNCIIGVRLLDGAAKTLLNDVVPAKVLSKTGNTITIQSSKSLNTSGQSELKYVYGNNDTGDLDTNHNTAIGFSSLRNATRSGFSVAVGAHALKHGKAISKTIAVGASAFERGNHTNSIGIGSHAGNKANTTNSIVVGVDAMKTASAVNNSIIIGNGVDASGEVSNKLAIGGGLTGDLVNHRYGINIPFNSSPLASFHVRPNGSRGSGRTTDVSGLLVEHDRYAIVKIDGVIGAELDLEAQGVTKFGLRYKADEDVTNIFVNDSISWKIGSNHAWVPNIDNRNSFGTHEKRLKEMYINTPDWNDNSDKATTTKWVDLKLNSHSYAKSRFRHQYYQNHYNGAEVYDIPMADNAVMRVIIMSVSIDGYAKVNLPESFTGYCAVQATDVGRGQKAIGANIQNGNVVEINNSGETGLNILAIGWYGW